MRSATSHMSGQQRAATGDDDAFQKILLHTEAQHFFVDKFKNLFRARFQNFV